MAKSTNLTVTVKITRELNKLTYEINGRKESDGLNWTESYDSDQFVEELTGLKSPNGDGFFADAPSLFFEYGGFQKNFQRKYLRTRGTIEEAVTRVAVWIDLIREIRQWKQECDETGSGEKEINFNV